MNSVVIAKPRETAAHSSASAAIVIALALMMGFVVSLAIGSDIDWSVIDMASWLVGP
jgi:hypothetical protein